MLCVAMHGNCEDLSSSLPSQQWHWIIWCVQIGDKILESGAPYTIVYIYFIVYFNFSKYHLIWCSILNTLLYLTRGLYSIKV